LLVITHFNEIWLVLEWVFELVKCLVSVLVIFGQGVIKVNHFLLVEDDQRLTWVGQVFSVTKQKGF
jgi:hypothetical protein